MSLAGFEHVFQGSVVTQLGPGAALRVASLPAVMLLKIMAYMDAPHRRAKDLQDIRLILRRYLHDSDELFSDAVFDAELPDFSLANAFLLGRDVGRLAEFHDTPVIEKFIDRVLAHQDSAADSGVGAGGCPPRRKLRGSPRKRAPPPCASPAHIR